MLTALTFFILLSILVLIHEFGHFIVAKRNGMLVEEFGFGLPPRIYGKKIGETIYSINLLPFGGFVKIFGETPEDLKKIKQSKQNVERYKQRAFNNKSTWQKTAVLIAGPTMNFILAAVLIAFMFTKGVYLLSDSVSIISVDPGSPAAQAGLLKGDIIRSVDSEPITSNDDLIKLSRVKAGQKVLLQYERNGVTNKILLVPRKNPPKGQGPMGVEITNYELKTYPFYLAPIVGVWESLKISAQFYQ
jgi:regulator of sigma E protease